MHNRKETLKSRYLEQCKKAKKLKSKGKKILSALEKISSNLEFISDSKTSFEEKYQNVIAILNHIYTESSDPLIQAIDILEEINPRKLSLLEISDNLSQAAEILTSINDPKSASKLNEAIAILSNIPARATSIEIMEEDLKRAKNIIETIATTTINNIEGGLTKADDFIKRLEDYVVILNLSYVDIINKDKIAQEKLDAEEKAAMTARRIALMMKSTEKSKSMVEKEKRQIAEIVAETEKTAEEKAAIENEPMRKEVLKAREKLKKMEELGLPFFVKPTLQEDKRTVYLHPAGALKDQDSPLQKYIQKLHSTVEKLEQKAANILKTSPFTKEEISKYTTEIEEQARIVKGSPASLLFDNDKGTLERKDYRIIESHLDDLEEQIEDMLDNAKLTDSVLNPTLKR